MDGSKREREALQGVKGGREREREIEKAKRRERERERERERWSHIPRILSITTREEFLCRGLLSIDYISERG